MPFGQTESFLAKNASASALADKSGRAQHSMSNAGDANNASGGANDSHQMSGASQGVLTAEELVPSGMKTKLVHPNLRPQNFAQAGDPTMAGRHEAAAASGFDAFYQQALWDSEAGIFQAAGTDGKQRHKVQAGIPLTQKENIAPADDGNAAADKSGRHHSTSDADISEHLKLSGSSHHSNNDVSQHSHRSGLSAESIHSIRSLLGDRSLHSETPQIPSHSFHKTPPSFHSQPSPDQILPTSARSGQEYSMSFEKTQSDISEDIETIGDSVSGDEF